MALTQLKTGAIADDAVTTDKLANAINTARDANTAKTTNATHTGDVTGATGLTIADNAVTLAKMAGGTDGQIITYDASGDPVAVGPGTDGQVLTSTGAGSPPAFEAIPASGKVLQVKHKASGAKVSSSAEIQDNSFTSGTECISIAITPTVATSVIHITGMLHFAHKSDYEGYWWLTYNHSGISESMIAGNANTSMRRTGLANSGGNVTTTMQPNSSVDLMLDHDTTNEITFKIRIGTSSSGQTMNFNRNPADSTDTSDGGNPISSITVMELADATITDDTVYRGT